jgi:hypothetical protein
MYPPVQLLYANKNFKINKIKRIAYLKCYVYVYFIRIKKDWEGNDMIYKIKRWKLRKKKKQNERDPDPCSLDPHGPFSMLLPTF